jgi:hypothetical protein
LNIIPVDQIHTVEVVPMKNKEFVFGIITKTRVYYIQAQNSDQMSEWILAIKNVIIPKVESPKAIDIDPESNKKTCSTPRDEMVSDSGGLISCTRSNGSQSSLPDTSSRNNSTAISPLADSCCPDAELSDSEEDHTTNSFQMISPGDDVVHAQGYLYKLKTSIGAVKSWKRYWFVLRNERLTYYKHQTVKFNLK